MKHCKRIAAAALAATALTALLGASSASATTLEVGGVTQNSSVTITTSITSGTSVIMRDTFGFSTNTCISGSGTGGTASPYSGSTVTGVGTNVVFGNCTNEPVIGHDTGILHISHISGTTNGTVTSSGAIVTTPSPFGTLTCVTGEGTHLGTLTGTGSAHATMHVNAQLPCSGISSRLTGTFTVTSPTGLGVSA